MGLNVAAQAWMHFLSNGKQQLQNDPIQGFFEVMSC